MQFVAVQLIKGIGMDFHYTQQQPASPQFYQYDILFIDIKRFDVGRTFNFNTFCLATTQGMKKNRIC